MKAAYFRAMDALHNVCVAVAAIAVVVITVIIPWGVFTRYVLNSASSWPEPLAILLMIWLSFLSAVVCYREHLHIAVGMLPNSLTGAARSALGLFIELCMMATNIFLFWFGTSLVQRTWYQSIAEFPAVSVGISYLPVPICGLITVLFGIERILKADWFAPDPTPDDVVGHTVSSE